MAGGPGSRFRPARPATTTRPAWSPRSRRRPSPSGPRQRFGALRPRPLPAAVEGVSRGRCIHRRDALGRDLHHFIGHDGAAPGGSHVTITCRAPRWRNCAGLGRTWYPVGRAQQGRGFDFVRCQHVYQSQPLRLASGRHGWGRIQDRDQPRFLGPHQCPLDRRQRAFQADEQHPRRAPCGLWDAVDVLGGEGMVLPEATLIMFSPAASTVINATPVAWPGTVFTSGRDKCGSRECCERPWRP